jgi:signal transduction histidine kinase
MRAQIRTPLNAMSGATALLASTEPLNEEQRSLLELLDAASDNIEKIIDDILQTSALSSGNFPVLREPLLLGRDVLQPAWRMMLLQPARRDKLARLRLSLRVDAAVPDALLGDPTRLLQVVTNMLSNATKFTPEGGAIELRVDVTAPPAADVPDGPALIAAAPLPPAPLRWLRIQVVDTGIGIEPGTHAHAEQPMQPADTHPAFFRSELAQDLRTLHAGGTVNRARVRRHGAGLDGAC